MSGHTPGPWEIAPRSDSDELWEIVSEYTERDGKKIANWIAEVDAQIDTVEMSEREQEEAMNEAAANAQLIISAPDLLAACQTVLWWNDRVGAMCQPEDERDVLAPLRAAIAKAEGR